MKITLDGLDGRNFTLRIPRDDGSEHVIALYDAKALRGAYEHDASRYSLAPVAADSILGAITWALSDGAIALNGPMVLGATRIALEIRRDDATPAITGEVRCEALDAPSLKLTRAGLSLASALSVSTLSARHDREVDAWDVACATLAARSFSLSRAALTATLEALEATTIEARHGGGTTDATLTSMTLSKLRVALEAMSVDVGHAALSGLRLVRAPDGSLVVTAESVELAELAFVQGQRRVEAPSIKLSSLRYGTEGISFGALTAGELRVSLAGLAERAATPAGDAPVVEATAERQRTLGIDLPFLDHLAGRLEADTLVDVKVPWIERRVATHRLRLSIVDGRFDFKQLERGLSRLEDAILDFEVDAQGLYFEVDAVVWKRTLLRWPLDARELLHAHQGRVRLRTFACPTVTVAQASKTEAPKGADPRFALRRVAVDNVRVELSIQGSSTLPIAGGAVRLGFEASPALGALKVHGSLSLDASKGDHETTLSLGVEALDLGLDSLSLGARRIDIGRARLGSLTDGSLSLRGFTPTAVAATLRALDLQDFSLTSSA